MKLTVTRFDKKTVVVDATETGIPGLVWHESIGEKGYTLTHTQSAYAVASSIRTKAKLKEAIRQIKMLSIDWTICRTTLIRTIRQAGLVDTIRRIIREAK